MSGPPHCLAPPCCSKHLLRYVRDAVFAVSVHRHSAGLCLWLQPLPRSGHQLSLPLFASVRLPATDQIVICHRPASIGFCTRVPLLSTYNTFTFNRHFTHTSAHSSTVSVHNRCVPHTSLYMTLSYQNGNNSTVCSDAFLLDNELTILEFL